MSIYSVLILECSKTSLCAISYEVQCYDLPSGGVDGTVVNNLAAK